MIWHNSLYTLTYKWPNVTNHPCDKIPGFFNLHLLNQGFKNARFVGREILQGRPNRHVNHWRAGVVFPQLPPGNFPRIGLALGDIYVDQGNAAPPPAGSARRHAALSSAAHPGQRRPGR